MISRRMTSFISVGFAATAFLFGFFEKKEVALMASSGESVQIMTFNIRYGTADDGDNRWDLRKNAMFKQITEINPDILGCQEALDFQIDQIQKSLPDYDFVGVGRDDGKKKGETCPIFYRKESFRLEDSGTFWFSDTPEVAGSKHWGNTLPRICTWARLTDRASGKGFYVYNLHIDHQSAESRLKSAQLLVKTIIARKHKDPFVVMGDFNADDKSPELKVLLESSGADWQPMKDALTIACPEQKDSGTFHNFTGQTDGGRIDFILTAPELKIREARIDTQKYNGRVTSDHFPVIVKVILN